ncbi:hypothetical protein CDES_12520 [Corynebacterium deserti GIMN1.010]|uniref:Rifampin ADP-ribosyltransferase domain-containing protein n=1 Tax=Corynebacterium deserti GIMN1.010 TaxID=931089 RepID=A0A0M5IRK0_9CORY|nr:hypothetical protein CDES_12520 [Corynebacterium deserti GIMN1.010]
MNHIYVTALKDGADLVAEVSAKIAAELDAGLPADPSVPRKTPHVYEVKALGKFDNDSNVTDKKFLATPRVLTAAISRSGLCGKLRNGAGLFPKCWRGDVRTYES